MIKQEMAYYLVGKALGYPIPNCESEQVGRVIYQDPIESVRLAQIRLITSQREDWRILALTNTFRAEAEISDKT